MAQRTNPEMVLNFSVLRTSLLRGLSRERLMATLSGFYGALAAVLAMGADKASILRMILREAMALLGAGLAIGVVLVLAAGGLTQAMLYGIKANDAVSLAPAVGALSVAAVCASLISAARATGVQPVEVLREELVNESEYLYSWISSAVNRWDRVFDASYRFFFLTSGRNSIIWHACHNLRQ